MGAYSLVDNTTGNGNVAVGSNAMNDNTSGASNTVVGNLALQFNTTGNFNTAIGNAALSLATTADNNVAVGHYAGVNFSTYNTCTFIGANTDATINNLTNAMAIGNFAKVDASNKVMVGNTLVTSIGGQVGWTTFSDRRLKTNIKKSKLGLDFILSLNPVNYEYKAAGQKGIIYTGLIAQEVDEAAKKSGESFSGG
jgi:hypothetical protein